MLLVQSSGKLEMERGMVKPMIRGEQQDSRSDVHFFIVSALMRPCVLWSGLLCSLHLEYVFTSH